MVSLKVKMGKFKSRKLYCKLGEAICRGLTAAAE